MAYPDSVVVSARGELLVGLSDGQIINAGRVAGPAGPRGESGLVGLRGEPGIDGLSCIAAFKAPSQDDGKEGDSWIDCSSAEFSFYIRSGNGWDKITTLRQPAKDPRMGVAGGGAGTGTGGGGGSGGGAEVHVGPEAPSFPSVGELWFDTNDDDGRMYVWTGDGWQPVLPQPDLDGYAKVEYVDEKTAGLPYRIETDKVLREGKADVRSGEAEIQLVDNEDNYSNVKFAGTNGVDVSSTASSIVIDGSKLAGDIAADLSSYATIAYSDGKDDNLQNQIDELQVQKGAAANYDCVNNSSTPYNARAGEIAFNNELSSAVTILGLGADDKSGRPTKSIQQGDIIEVVGLDGSDTRYKVTDSAGAPTYILVNYIAGEQGFALNVQYTVYIYPQNEAGATKEYVDLQDDLKLDLAGGTLTGPLIADGTVTINGNATYNGTSNEEESLVTRKYVDDAVNTGGDFLPTTGGTMTGKLSFTTGLIQGGDYGKLSGRASLQISTNSDLPVVIETGSSYKSAFSIFGYDAGSPDNRKPAITLKGNGGIEATGSYVGQLIKSIRNTGYAFEAKPDDIATTALIRTNGSADFTNKLTLLKADTTDHSGFTIKGTVNGGTEGNLLQSYHNAGTNVDAVNYNGKMTEGTNIVTKSYVDSALGARPAQLMWRWEGDKGSTTTAPSAKRFLRSESSGTDYLRFSFETMNNVDLGDALFSDTNVSLSSGPIGCIWYQDAASGKWRLKMQFRVQSWRWNYNSGGGAHFEYGFSSRHGREWSNFTIGADYYVTIGGFF